MPGASRLHVQDCSKSANPCFQRGQWWTLPQRLRSVDVRCQWMTVRRHRPYAHFGPRQPRQQILGLPVAQVGEASPIEQDSRTISNLCPQMGFLWIYIYGYMIIWHMYAFAFVYPHESVLGNRLICHFMVLPLAGSMDTPTSHQVEILCQTSSCYFLFMGHMGSDRNAVTLWWRCRQILRTISSRFRCLVHTFCIRCLSCLLYWLCWVYWVESD